MAPIHTGFDRHAFVIIYEINDTVQSCRIPKKI